MRPECQSHIHKMFREIARASLPLLILQRACLLLHLREVLRKQMQVRMCCLRQGSPCVGLALGRRAVGLGGARGQRPEAMLLAQRIVRVARVARQLVLNCALRHVKSEVRSNI